jgi:hypothetical protein
MSVVELNAVTSVWQYLGYETLEIGRARQPRLPGPDTQ